MKLTYLGTAAAEGIPGLFCQCKNCIRARELGGRNIRTRSQALVDDCLLIDFPPDTFLHTLYHGLDITKIKSCIVTHAHSDHLYAPDLEMRKVGFAILPKNAPTFTVYAARRGYEMICESLKESRVQPERVQAEEVIPGEVFEVEGFRVLPLPAKHAPKTTPVVFVVEKDGKRFGYFHDTSILPEESWVMLETLDGPMQLVSLDCTEGTMVEDSLGHMNLSQCIRTKERLLAIGAANEQTVFVLNHFSHNGENTLYDELLPYAEAAGFVVSYDGMTIKF
ncbi:MAG: hypothetical protein J6J43_07075 [Oscillospiraceae bacterium]|nr:hypothetical protein [Oscillospiraceae bacterium]